MNNNKEPQDEEIRGDNHTNSVDADTANPAEKAEDTTAGSNSEQVESQTELENSEDESDTGAKGTGSKAQHEKKKKKRADSRKLRYGSTATVLTIIVIAAVVLLNVVAGILNDRYPMKLDLTKDKLFTLSEESKSIAKGVSSDIKVTVFADETLFENPDTGDDNYNTIFRQFYEATKQYNSLSGGKVTTTYLDLTKSPAEARQYTQYDINSGDILFQCGDRTEKTSFNNLYTAEQNQYTQQATNVQSKVEQQLASKIVMVTSANTPVITLLTGHEEDATAKAGLTELFGNNNYSVEDLNISSSSTINDKTVLAVICAPTTDYSQQEIKKLREWLDNSGKLDHHLMVIANYSASCPNLYQFLNVEYGIEVTSNLISETDNNRIYSDLYGQGDRYLVYGDIASTDYTSELAGKYTVMPVCLQLITNKENNADNTLSNVDLVTFPKTAKITPIADMKDSEKQAAQSDASEYPIVGMAYASKTAYDSDSKEHSTKVLVSGSQLMFGSDYMQMTSAYNEKAVLSTINGITGNEESVTISSKPLKKTTMEFTQAQAKIFWAVFVIVIPLALLIVCLVVFRRRRRL